MSLTGPPDPPLGGTYQVESTALPDQAALTLAPGGKAHISLTYLVASKDDTPSGGGNPLWIPKSVTVTIPGTDATLGIPWASRLPVLRQDMASIPGTFASPFLAGSGLGTAATPGPTATVKAYVAAINRHDYALAWKLGGVNLTTYQNFVNTYTDVKEETLHILSVAGNEVTADVTDVQDSGTSTTSKVIFTVLYGVITSFHFP